MQADKTTLTDLAIFNHEEEQSVFHHFNFTRTVDGKDWLRQLLSRPLDSVKQVRETQLVIKRIIAIQPQWPQKILNGTIMVMQRYYETSLNAMPSHPNFISSYSYKIFNAPDYGIIRYSVTHFIDFLQGLNELKTLLQADDNAPLLKNTLDRITQLLQREQVLDILAIDKTKKLKPETILYFGNYLLYHFKEPIRELMNLYSMLDAYYSLATACLKYDLQFPVFTEEQEPSYKATQLYHPLLESPVAYDVDITPQRNFMFLTGANMGGKSTFIKAVGVSVYLAHIGMAVPATAMQLTLFDGLLSNIQVSDNIVKGESYFFNEVQRIRKTIEKISDGKKWLILIDELFKGTNMQDAMKCSTTVIEGLRKMKNALFVLSTHLYEIGENLSKYSNIQFRYFETEVQDDQLIFSYQLKEGISNDRLGYLILKKEGVVSMLEKL